MRDTTAAGLEATIRGYYDACNEASVDKIMSFFTPDAVHYFPAGAPQGTFFGARKIAEGWVNAVRNLGSIWTIDRMLVDASRREAVVEWTHFKPKAGVYLRGDEWFVFSADGLISEIRAYYSCPAQTDPLRNHEIGDFPYAKRGYPLVPPPVRREDR